MTTFPWDVVEAGEEESKVSSLTKEVEVSILVLKLGDGGERVSCDMLALRKKGEDAWISPILLDLPIAAT
jgi:hypothetical protein